MLSIHFDKNIEWWVSDKTFERLFQFALDNSLITQDLAHMRDVVEANGGFDFTLEDNHEALTIRQGLQQAAQLELQRLVDIDQESEDVTYQLSLRKLLEEFFDQFLMIMDDQLEYLADQAASLGIKLDFSLDDCDKVEQLFDKMSLGKNKDEVKDLIILFARHVGEIVRNNYGGNWTLSLDEVRNVNFNSPVIIGHTAVEGLEFAPISLMRAYSLRPRKGMIRTAIDAQINHNIIDLSDLIEE